MTDIYFSRTYRSMVNVAHYFMKSSVEEISFKFDRSSEMKIRLIFFPQRVSFLGFSTFLSENIFCFVDSAVTTYCNLGRLSRMFKDKMALPLIQHYRTSQDLPQLHGLMSLNQEAKARNNKNAFNISFFFSLYWNLSFKIKQTFKTWLALQYMHVNLYKSSLTLYIPLLTDFILAFELLRYYFCAN